MSLTCRCKLFSKIILHENWSTKFNQKKNFRVRRVFLENSFKMFFKMKFVDVKNRALALNEEKYYYLWHKDISLLYEEEEFDLVIYLIRSSYYDLKKRVDKICFLKKFKVVKQNEKVVDFDNFTHSTSTSVKKFLKLFASQKFKKIVINLFQFVISILKRQLRKKVEMFCDDEQTNVDTNAKVFQKSTSIKKKNCKN